jgi:hypothetical protein
MKLLVLKIFVMIAALGGLLICNPAIAADTPAANKPLRIFYIGNSVTDQLDYTAFAAMAATRGHDILWARHMIPGAPLFYMWEHEDGFETKPFGSSRNALANYPWDVITLEPFDREFHDGTADKPEGDLDIAQRYIDLASKLSPDAQFYIYSRWPRISRNNHGFKFDKDAYKNASGEIDLSKIDGVDDYTDRWLTTYVPRRWSLKEESRDYFQKLTLAIRQQNPHMAKPVLLIPVGDVMNELHQEMKAGKVPGYTSIYQVYADGIHLNPVGRYIIGCTFYATIFKDKPRNLSSAAYHISDATVAGIIQDAAWKVVSTNPYAGVTAELPTTNPSDATH